jgi:hypothetical protein
MMMGHGRHWANVFLLAEFHQKKKVKTKKLKNNDFEVFYLLDMR